MEPSSKPAWITPHGTPKTYAWYLQHPQQVCQMFGNAFAKVADAKVGVTFRNGDGEPLDPKTASAHADLILADMQEEKIIGFEGGYYWTPYTSINIDAKAETIPDLMRTTGLMAHEIGVCTENDDDPRYLLNAVIRQRGWTEETSREVRRAFARALEDILARQPESLSGAPQEGDMLFTLACVLDIRRFQDGQFARIKKGGQQ